MDDEVAKMLASEPDITVNGVALTPSQAMTVRVAVTNLHMEMSGDDALGGDDTGRGIASGYKDRSSEVLRIMIDRPLKT